VEYCPTGGCAPADVGIGSNMEILQHETVHAVADPLGSPRPMWAEGLADAFLPGPLIVGEDHPSTMIGQASRDVDYNQAGRFVRYVWHTVSPDAVVQIYRATPRKDVGGSRRVFEDVVGESLDAVGDRFLSEATPGWPPSLAPEPETLEWSGPTFRHEIVADCDGDEVTQASLTGGYQRTIYVRNHTAGLVELDSDAMEVRITYQDAFDNGRQPYYFPTLLDLEAGTYKIDIIVPTRERTDAFVSFRPVPPHRSPSG
jgi:hypothetical protein